MTVDTESGVEQMKKIAESFFHLFACKDYGDDAVEHVATIAGVAAKLYRHIDLNTEYNIVIYKPLDDNLSLRRYFPNANNIRNYEWFASNSSRVLIIEPMNEYGLQVVCEEFLDLESIRQNAIIYTFSGGVETIWGKSTKYTLPNNGELVSYFSPTTYKTLEEALSSYEVRKAKYSNCKIMSEAWFDDNRIFLKSGSPEEHFRNSLLVYLDNCLRADVKVEQNVSPTEPIDIKVTFDIAKHIALIEVKWLGKSLHPDRSSFSQEMYDSAAKKGAKQLADYLDSHKTITSQLTTKGYLVVFDARRSRTKVDTRDINRKNGFYYENRNIIYDPQFHSMRNDFAEPRRFFIAPNVTP